VVRYRKIQEYPRVVYGPHGASMTIDGPDQWPAGWTAEPEKPGGPPPTPSPRPPYSRSELKRRLRAAGKSFNESAADTELWGALING